MESSVAFLTAYIEEFTYVGIFIALFLCGIGFPLSEELILIVGGFIAFEGYTNIFYTFIVGFIGVVIGDLIIFNIGRKWGSGKGRCKGDRAVTRGIP